MFGLPKRKGRIAPEPKKPKEPELDLSGDFRIVVPINVIIPISPLETFSQRVIKEYDIQQSLVRKNVRSSIFQPLPNGKLRIYPREVGRGSQ